MSGLLVALQLECSTAAAAGSWTWPIRGPVLTVFHNGADPYAAGQHRGVDIGAAVGAPVVAAAAGTVVYAGVVGTSGLTVAERTDDARYELSYLHLSSTAVRAGAHVDAGARVGAVGTSGQRSIEQPHLHFGVREAAARNAYLDPLDFLAPPPAERPAPRPAPAPAPAAEPARPAPAPAPAAPGPALVLPPFAAPAPAPHGSAHRSHRAAAQGPSPLRHAHPHAGPSPLRHALPAGAATPLHAARPAGAPGAPRPVPRPAAPGTLGDAPGAPRGTTAGSPATRAPLTAAGHGAGIDAGWLAACLGLVVAAVLLAHPDRARTAARRSRAGVDALLRPLRERG